MYLVFYLNTSFSVFDPTLSSRSGSNVGPKVGIAI